MEIKWEPRAAAALEQLIDYRLEVAGKLSARRLLAKIETAAGYLTTHPELGVEIPHLQGLKYDYRSLVADKNHKIIYRIDTNTIYISALFDCRQDPKTLTKRLKQR